jgi:hypothetical protein
MDIDPILDDVRRYLREHFEQVDDQPSQGDYFVFGLTLLSGHRRQLKVHRDIFIFSESIPAYLRECDFAAQLELGDVQITEPVSQ